ncbi:MAG: D-aminoacylase [Gemmatimonadota bacterium]|nr:D-aminoacylase [Gemmatimonadota bacterium]
MNAGDTPAIRLVGCVALMVGAYAATAPGASAWQAPSSGTTLLAGATVIDGTGAPSFHGDVLVRDGRIAAVGESGSIPLPPGAERVDLTGLVLAPGFIDLHNHSTRGILDQPAAVTQVSQGITTLMVGADGSSPWPVGEYLDEVDEARPAVDVGTLVGHGTVRRAALGDDFRRTASDPEIADMAERVARGMSEGAFGLSSGLEYDPGFYSSTGELIALAREAAAAGGFYMSHMRDEEETLIEAVAEAIQIGREAGLPVQISHIKAGNASVWGKAGEVLGMIAAANAGGLDVTADQYPYTAWQSGLAIVVRSRMFQDPDSVAAGIAAIGGGDRLQIVRYRAEPDLNGMRLSEIAERKGLSEVDAYMLLMRSGGSSVIGHTMSEADVDEFMESRWVMTSSDGGIGSPHPRGAGTFPRVLGHYVRERGVIGLERAVQRASSMPARRLGLDDRGVIRVDARADLVAFDPAIVADRSTFADPAVTSVGIETVWVAGVPVWADGATTGARPGRALRHPRGGG